jgi:hypothetical protein
MRFERPAIDSSAAADLLDLRFLKPLLLGDLRQRLELGLSYYAYLRPDEGLGAATPSEIYFGLLPAHLAAVSPPRGIPGQGPRASPFQIRFLDPERRLPFLAPKAA